MKKLSNIRNTNKKKRVDNATFVIQMFGIDEKGETYSISVDDFYPFFYIRVSDLWENDTVVLLSRFIKK